MDYQDADLAKLLTRTTITKSFSKIIPAIEDQFPSIGKILKYSPINEGYEDANIFLTTTKTTYVLKIFLAERTQDNIDDYVKVLEASRLVGVPTTQLVSRSGGFIGTADNSRFIITKYFDGQNFQNTTPTLQDMIVGVKYLAKLNSLSFPIHESYDSWGNKNLVREHALLKHKLTSEQLNILEPVIKEFPTLNFTRFTKSVIHGDMQRKHLLKNQAGEYCILDFGCMAYDPKVIDLSTYLAWFCLAEDTWEQREEIFKTIMKAYGDHHLLSEEEIASIKPLVRASYAAYFQKTSELIYDGDQSAETVDWNVKSRTLLKLSANW